MDSIIRRAVRSDLPKLLELYELLATGDEPRLALEAAEARFDELAVTEGHRIFVAESGSEIVGTFALVFVGGLAHTARDSAVVEDVVVAVAHQGAGIGRRMMAFAMRECALRGCYKLALSSHLRRDSAHRFYEGMGFRKHGFSFLVDGLATEEREA